MPLALCPVSLKRTTVRRFFCLDLVSGLCSLCDRCCPTSSRHSVVVKNKRENDTLSLVVDFIAIRGKEELSPFVRSTVLLGPLLCALSSFFLLFLFDGAGHEEKKKEKTKRRNRSRLCGSRISLDRTRTSLLFFVLTSTNFCTAIAEKPSVSRVSEPALQRGIRLDFRRPEKTNSFTREKKKQKKKHALLISSDTAKSSSPPNFCNTLDTSSFVWPVISISVLMVVFSVFPPMMMSYTR